MRLFIAGRSRLPARFERRLDIDPCPVTHMMHQPSPGPLGPGDAPTQVSQRCLT